MSGSIEAGTGFPASGCTRASLGSRRSSVANAAPSCPWCDAAAGIYWSRMNSDRVLPDSQPCPNCGDTTPGSYCRACGQRRVARVLSLRRLVADAVEDQFSLNAALPRTLGLLFTHPGMLTTEFLRGHIANYIPPFRLYLLTSFMFFLAAAMFGCNEENDGGMRVGFSGDSAGVSFSVD